MMRGTLIAWTIGAWLVGFPLLLMAHDTGRMTHGELVEYLGVHPDFEDDLQEIEKSASVPEAKGRRLLSGCSSATWPATGT